LATEPQRSTPLSDPDDDTRAPDLDDDLDDLADDPDDAKVAAQYAGLRRTTPETLAWLTEAEERFAAWRAEQMRLGLWPPRGFTA
jgi:hypothetical protein